MQRQWLAYVILILLIYSNSQGNENYWQQFVHYSMSVTLLPGERALNGSQTIEYQNNSPDTLRKFYLHLYPNAYRNNNSIYAKEARRYYRQTLSKIKDAGYIQIESFRIVSQSPGGEEKSLNAFKVNDTILEADLPEPLPPGGTLKVELAFYLKVRNFARRAGYRDSQYDFAQWYPKVCVYDENGWQAEPFHFMGEFYGEFGTFDVTMNVPFNYIIGATGEVIRGDPGWNLVQVDTSLSKTEWQAEQAKMKSALLEQSQQGGSRTVAFHAENVHDFAWVASPDFLYESGNWDGIPIHVLYRSRARNKWSKTVRRRSVRALEWLSEKFGRYPYPQLTVAHGLLGGGMEYPMLVMNSSERESLILHEVGHIYFYGILANNEWKEAWLDEGFTSFQTRWYMESRYGKWGFDRAAMLRSGTLLQKLRPDRTSREQNLDKVLSYMNSGHNEPISKPAYAYEGPVGYSRNAYTKGAFFYDMLKYVVGDENFQKICTKYFERWKFKHVNRARFQQVCQEISGLDLHWFFDQWLDKAVTIDYRLEKVEKSHADSLWQTQVYIVKMQSGTMPVDVQLTTLTGDTLVQRWDGIEKVGWVNFQTSAEPDQVILDPRDAILDNSRFNNQPLKAHLIFDYPNMTYRPHDALLFTWRPSGWYNDVDKMRIGGRLRGWQAQQKSAEFGVWYGVHSNLLDARLQYSSRITALGPRSQGALLVQRMEGRVELDANLSFAKSRSLSNSRQYKIQFGFNHSKLLSGDARLYTLREFNNTVIPTWSKGTVNKVYASYSVNPRGLTWFANLDLGVESVQEDWGSDFTFNAISGELKLRSTVGTNDFYLRAFGKKIYTSEDIPVQEMILLDGANPRERFRRFYLRSAGSLPNGLHFHMPGGGNVRGYYDQFIAGKEMVAVNFEFRKKVKKTFSWPALNLLLQGTALVGFVDVANLAFPDLTDEFFADAGFGLRIQKFLPDDWYTIFTGGRKLTIRLDFPIWVNRPLPDEKNLRFRWVLGVEQAI